MVQVERRSQSRVNLMGKTLGSVRICDPYGVDGYVEGEILNISDSGFCLGITKPLNRFEIVKILVPYSNDHLSKIPTLGEIRWLKPDVNRSKGYTLGLRFII